LANASGDGSFTKSDTSSGVGGRPIRSNVARRMSASRAAGGDGCILLASSFARTNASTGVFTQLASWTVGTGGSFTG
jgi:hypothetical protein